MNKLDVAIIGAGSAGLSARSVVKNYTDNYLVFDGGVLGTTCARVGCMPSKVLIQAANDFDRRRVFAQEGILGSEALRVDIEQTFSHVRSLRDRFVKSVAQGMQSWQKTHLISSSVRFLDPHTLETQDGQRFEAEKIIMAVGSKPIVPKVFSGFESFCVDTDAFFELTQIPKRWVVVGTGVIGLELGQALHRLGCEVTIIGRNEKSLAGITDPEILSYTKEKLGQEFALVFESIQNVEKSAKGGLDIHTDHQVLQADCVLMAAGRGSNLGSLDLDQAGLDLKENTIPDYDPQTLLVDGSSHLFIAGDANDELAILHEASDEGRIAGYNACQDTAQSFTRRTPLGVTFTDPNIAYAGQKYSQLKDENKTFVTGKVSFEGQGRSIVKLKEKGLLHVYASKETGHVWGAEVFGPDAEHLAHLIAWSIGENLTVDDMLAKPFYHPVIEEGLRTALREIKKGTFEIEIPPVSIKN